MRLLPLCFLLFKVSRAEDLTPVSAYVGENVTLRSGADPKWELTDITWSIWPNTTWIATYSNDGLNQNQFYKYIGRLHLNTSTGDLMIKNVTSADELEYTVDFYSSDGRNQVNKIKLNIKQQLLEPVIEIIQKPIKDSCVVTLNCSSSNTGVSLSWRSNPRLQMEWITGFNSNIFLAILDTQRTIDITCIATKNMDNNTRTIHVKCSSPPPCTTVTSPTLTPQGIRDHILAINAVAVFVILCTLFFFVTKRRGRLGSCSPEGSNTKL
ncbi:carcinoembryonic antigen-related cell adhesion molecule 1 isoform X2 [Boleophthalmus pectinirostris]|uniref:carcinoembryonic antigen-related cell adhesion molecule 1 isoform X2 n=1 Tax=Boleophthalmus pectinirostris TaxID=150288 RepID=UPI00242E35AF|nr:carcinoembryonic antigen-related cell adhesion molecule 1 isoform X2 [Boleophthalmus pectinirostris]